nr:MAG TPA: hypothetical protein [Caudoviricetes sp.]
MVRLILESSRLVKIDDFSLLLIVPRYRLQLKYSFRRQEILLLSQ